MYNLLKSKYPRFDQVEDSNLDHQIVQHFDLVGLVVGDANEVGDGAMQVQQRVQLDSGLGGPKRCPRTKRQTQIDGAGVERVDSRVQFYSQWLLGMLRSGYGNKMLSEVGINLPRVYGIRFSQRVARNRRAAKVHVVETIGSCPQTDFDIAQGLAVGKLPKRHGKELIKAGIVFGLVVAAILGNAPAKRTHGQIGYELRKTSLP